MRGPASRVRARRTETRTLISLMCSGDRRGDLRLTRSVTASAGCSRMEKKTKVKVKKQLRVCGLVRERNQCLVVRIVEFRGVIQTRTTPRVLSPARPLPELLPSSLPSPFRVLWPELGWKPVPLVDIIEGNAVKRAYQRALLCLHPDKLQQKVAASDKKYIAEKVFDILQEAWTQFNMISAL